MSDDPLSEADKRLFRQTVENLKSLKASAKKEVLREKEAPLTTQIRALPLSSHYTYEVSAESILSFCRPGIPKKRFLALSHGLIPFESRLDLHGLRPEQAQDSLLAWLSQEIHLKHRCLLLIHGKGGLRGEAPILKNLVNHWLKQIPEVLAFHSAIARQGGTGALFILLKKLKEST